MGVCMIGVCVGVISTGDEAAPTDLDLPLGDLVSVSRCRGGGGGVDEWKGEVEVFGELRKLPKSLACCSFSSLRSLWLSSFRSAKLGKLSLDFLPPSMSSSLGEKTTFLSGDGDRERLEVLELDRDRGSSCGNRSADLGVVGMGDCTGGRGSVGDCGPILGDLWGERLGGGRTGMLTNDLSGVEGESGAAIEGTAGLFWSILTVIIYAGSCGEL